MVVAAFCLLGLWERANLGSWPRGERLAFWVSWMLVLCWSSALVWHASLPTLPGLAARLFNLPAGRYLTPHPDIFW